MIRWKVTNADLQGSHSPDLLNSNACLIMTGMIRNDRHDKKWSQNKKTCGPKPNSLSYSKKGHAKRIQPQKQGHSSLVCNLSLLPESLKEKSSHQLFSLPFLPSWGVYGQLSLEAIISSRKRREWELVLTVHSRRSPRLSHRVLSFTLTLNTQPLEHLRLQEVEKVSQGDW